MPKHYIYISLLALLTATSSIAQQRYHYNINSYNGLHSNHVYCAYKDRLGYLWIGTDNGVIQYNGYEAKIHDISSGLVDADVWNFHEDRKGRLWLSRISEEFGYIYNGAYHEVYSRDNKISVFYPKYVREYDAGVKFITTDGGIFHLCTEKNDTLNIKELAKWQEGLDVYITPSANVFLWSDGVLYDIDDTSNSSVELIKKCENDRYKNRVLMRDFLMPKEGQAINELVALNTNDCTEIKLDIDSSEILYNQYENGSKNYIITDKTMSVYDKDMQNGASYLLTDYLPVLSRINDRVVYIMEDTFWNSCIGTRKSGLFMSFDMPYYSIQNTGALEKYKYVGKGNNYTNYWWNNENRTLKYSSNETEYKEKKYPDVSNVSRIEPYTSTEVLMFSQSDIFILNTNTMALSSYGKDAGSYSYNHITDSSLSRFRNTEGNQGAKIASVLCGRFDKNGTLYCATRGYGYMFCIYNHDTLVCNRIDGGRYNDVLYHSSENIFIAYNEHSILIHSKDTLLKIGKQQLREYNISKIEKIEILNNSYALIKDYNKIMLCDLYCQKFTELFNHRGLSNSLTSLYGNVLITAGKFGVQFSKINITDLTTSSVFYPNLKGLAYNLVFDIATYNNSIVLNTDSGLVTISIPNDSLYRKDAMIAEERHRFVLKYNSEYRSIQNSDTIIVGQKNRDLLFEVINPAGVGKPIFQSLIKNIDTTWNTWGSNELHLPEMEVGQYHTIHVKVFDDVWESEELSIVVYLPPTFWQTRTGHFLFWGSICLLSILVILTTAYYTIKVVTKKNDRNNYMLSLELKSIYAQINPHFIFNTLNTSLYYISEHKNDDAYKHISAFSELLRSYIKSARNKHISLQEEIENLENYIQLYQSRYEDKFTYSIHVDDTINTGDTIIPALLLQPFVENAIQHGLLNMDSSGVLTLSFLSSSGGIECIIDDNGIGRQKSAMLYEEKRKKTDSYGNELINELIQIINAENKEKISIRYIDKSSPLTGTTVIITIKTLRHG